MIYTKQSVCAPIRAEEGITGILCPPKSSTSFVDLPNEIQIGGYPTAAQLANSNIDAATLDSEGRCVVLEFPAFVLLGVYSPANRDESRDDFRLGFLDLLDARVRNLIAMGKNVVLSGDLNISREELDTANAEVSMRKMGLSDEDYVSTPSRRLFNQLLENGKVLGDRDEGRETQVMWDICRGFHPDRKGMFTCWEQKTNARPGNYGARIDYILCSLSMKDWFCSSNIQEGLMVFSKYSNNQSCKLMNTQGSDHCPVYAVLKNRVQVEGRGVDLLDVMNPAGMFLNGIRQREYSKKDILPLSGKLIPEFDGRRNIRDMFSRKPSLVQTKTTDICSAETEFDACVPSSEEFLAAEQSPRRKVSTSVTQSAPLLGNTSNSLPSPNKKRPLEKKSIAQPPKRLKPGSSMVVPPQIAKSQQNLQGFFRPKAGSIGSIKPTSAPSKTQPAQAGIGESAYDLLEKTTKTQRSQTPDSSLRTSSPEVLRTPQRISARETIDITSSPEDSSLNSNKATPQGKGRIYDEVESKKSWSKLFTKPAAPMCESHSEPCISFQTKKSGMNCGRSFWMCPRPLGPSGDKEKNTEWRCNTFIWCSDWDAISARERDSRASTSAAPNGR